MPSNLELLRDYSLVVDEFAFDNDALPSDTTNSSEIVTCPVFVWINVANPCTLSHEIRTKPIRALLDTGFGGGLFISREQLGNSIGLTPVPESVIGPVPVTFNRVGGKVNAILFSLDVWA